MVKLKWFGSISLQTGLILFRNRNIKALKCYTCEDGIYDDECRSDWIECPFENQICMTEMRQENGAVRITKGCKQRTACDQHVVYDYNTCTAGLVRYWKSSHFYCVLVFFKNLYLLFYFTDFLTFGCFYLALPHRSGQIGLTDGLPSDPLKFTTIHLT